MEKYGQYRDKGSGIAPFFPVPPPANNSFVLPWHLFLFCVRLPLVTFAWFVWLAAIQYTPPGGVLRKANLWCVLGIPGVWWIDLQVDGVRRGSLSQAPRGRIPGAGTIIASSYTSPLDVLYLAAIFDPIFTEAQADSRLVRPVSIEGALAACFDVTPPFHVHTQHSPLPLSKLLSQNRDRAIVVFPESTTSNGRGILSLSPALLSAAKTAKIFPVSLRYTPADVVTPIPGWLEVFRFIWRLNSGPTHCIRVRIGAPTTIASAIPQGDGTPAPTVKHAPRAAAVNAGRNGYESNFFDTMDSSGGEEKDSGKEGDETTDQERKALDAVAESLARLGRVKRVGLGVEEKRRFVEAWNGSGKNRRR